MNKMMKIGLSMVLTGIAMNGYSAVVSNLLADASFEALVDQEPDAGSTPWFTEGEDNINKVQPSTDYAVTGAQSIKYANNDSPFAIQNLGVEVDSNAIYEASAWIRTSESAGSHTDAPKLQISIYTSATTNGVYAYRKTILGNTPNTTTNVWERFVAVLDGSDLSGWHDEYIQVRFRKNDGGTSHWLHLDDVEFGESQVPDNLLVAWDATAGAGDYTSAGATGNLALGHALKTAAGSTDSTFGTLPLATDSDAAFEVRTATPGTSDTVTFSIENTSAKLLELDSIHFDYGRWFDAAPQDVILSYDSGDLDIVDGTTLSNAMGILTTAKLGDYTDFDVSLTHLNDYALLPGESATFRLVASNAGGSNNSGAFDNIAILGSFSTILLPDNLLIAWDTTAALGGDYSSADITGNLFTGSAYALDATAGSTDLTFGTLPGATNALSAFAVRAASPGDKDTVTFVIENTSASQSLELDSISFDYSRWFADSPQDVRLIYAYGDLDMTNGTPVFAATGISATGKTGDYMDFDVSLTNLSDHVLEPGKKAGFNLVVSNAVSETTSGAFDNIAVLGSHVTMSYEYWESTWGVDLGSETEDYDNDGWDNLTEYGLGGNPTNGFIQGWVPYVTNTVDGLFYLHGQHATDTSLTYYLETTDDLVSPAWTNSGYSVVGTNVTGFSHNWVTNSVPTTNTQTFIRLIIEN